MAISLPVSLHLSIRAVITLFLLAAFTIPASSQAAPTAIRKEALDVFAAGAYSATDYGDNDKGFIIGGDVTRHFRLFDPSLTVRLNKVSGSAVGEKSFTGGLKLERAYGRFHPYAQLLVGYGVITFNTPFLRPDGTFYSYDNSVIYDAGAGVDIDLTRSFALKIDAQYQHWRLGRQTDSIILEPGILAVGLVYRIPYRFLRPRRY